MGKDAEQDAIIARQQAELNALKAKLNQHDQKLAVVEDEVGLTPPPPPQPTACPACNPRTSCHTCGLPIDPSTGFPSSWPAPNMIAPKED